MFNPVATYRIQFHKDFNFDAFEQIIPYLQKLGVSTLYASPIFEATPGSTHGYDGVDPHKINPEIGTIEQLKSIREKLQQAGINWLQDIVPNHMAFHPNNKWLMDVLEYGKDSAYAPFFDLVKGGDERIMVPFLGSPLEEVVRNKELRLALEDGKLVLKYFDNTYPVSRAAYRVALAGNGQMPASISSVLSDAPSKGSSIQFAALKNNVIANDYIEEQIKEVNSNPERLLQLATQQHYRLCHWQETDGEINYRRFFTVNGLICLNIQDKEVFQTYHKLVKQLVDDGTFQGLRIDHIDGLYAPEGYLQQLRELAGENTYVAVEKILEPGEDLPTNWPLQGNTGYDFLSVVNNLFTNKDAEEPFTKFYQQLTGIDKSIHQQMHEKKSHILYEHMRGELKNLHTLFVELELAGSKELKKIDAELLQQAIGEFLIHCPVYRYYGNRLPLGKDEADAVKDILQSVRKKHEPLKDAVDLLESVLLEKPKDGDDAYNAKALRFYQRCMQFTGPLMAKGVEDTLMYTYNRFIAHNDVGDAPESFGMSVEKFHKKMMDRQEHWPLSINATSTHDTKRGEDVRARLNVLTDIPGDWIKTVKGWQKMNAGLKKNGMPDANDEYFIYQNLVGAHPMPGEGEDEIGSRLEAYLEKALREAKVHSNWTSPNAEYEHATKIFIRGLLDKNGKFWKAFQKFQYNVIDAGIINSLSQVLLKFTCPGVPDTYQGTELWDLSLVDPDNRRPANYEQRAEYLKQYDTASEGQPQSFLEQLWQGRYDAQIKLWLTHTLLQLRKDNTDLFAKGHYIPLQVKGKYKEHVIAFARRYQHTWLVVAAPLHTTILSKQQKKDIQYIDWKDTRIVLPEEMQDTSFEHLLNKAKGKTTKDLSVGELFTPLPFAVLKLQAPANERGAGILLSVTSLPSDFGVGDLGPAAYEFADFLSKGNQRYWQLLPLNPTEAGSGHSPYSSYSSMGGNPLLISPELLVKEGLLAKHDIKEYHLPHKDFADYEGAMEARKELFELAYKNFRTGNFFNLQQQFRAYCKAEAYWLDDLALYAVLREEHDCKPWYEWADEYKARDTSVLTLFANGQADKLDKIKWLQFIFAYQWKKLRDYCNSLGIQLFGDMPFYVSHDSADVWAHREIFALDEEGQMAGVAGVPPDYFSADGQWWGMPTFKWDAVKAEGYKWWVDRMRKNLQLFDLLRIDHFRALAEYWEVPAGETTAKNGKWLDGPGVEFFEVMKKELGKLPFVAEDLGDKMEKVYELRDEVGLPGMKVLQFAFGDNMPDSVDIPHNYKENCIVYTGTHDNNTTLGWYEHESNKADHKRFEHYLGHKSKIKDIYYVMARVAYSSIAKTAIVPMQDILGLDEQYRMNMPGRAEGNWQWRLKPGVVNDDTVKLLRNWTKWYRRG
ncbi:MAG: malto-oligosyltrehalose synthase [Sphingobacteriales bacterium]|nr:MAG: malto-oligosyltrehalose synthase [Sphingobacteriales bacterium]